MSGTKERKPQTDEHAVVVRQMDQLPVSSTADVFALARAFAQAHVLGARNDAEGVLALKVVMEKGVVSANERYHIRQGQLSKKYQAIVNDFFDAGGKYQIVRRDPECAELVASFGDTRDMTFRFSWEDAQQEPFIYSGGPDQQMAQLKKPIEKRTLKDKYATPRSRMQMLWARVISDMGNALCPRACEGMYPPEVVEDFDDAPRATPEPITDAEAAKRAAAAKVVAVVVEGDDFSVCPDGFGEYSGKPWTEIEVEMLQNAYEAASVNANGLTEQHAGEIEKALRMKGVTP